MGLQGNDDIMKIHLLKDADVPPSRFCHGMGRRMTVGLQKVLGKRARIDTNADRNTTFLGLFDNGLYPVPSPNIARIETQGRNSGINSGKGQAIIKMDIGNDGNGAFLGNDGKGLCSLHGRNRTADHFTAQFLQVTDLGKGGCRVFRLCIGHGLDYDGMAAANGDRTDLYFPRFSSFHITSP